MRFFEKWVCKIKKKKVCFYAKIDKKIFARWAYVNAFSAKWMQSFHILLHSAQNCVEKKSYNRSQGNGLIERKKKQIERRPNPKCDIHKIFTINPKVTSCYRLFLLLMDKKSFKWWIQIRTKIFRVGLDREVGMWKSRIGMKTGFLSIKNRIFC